MPRSNHVFRFNTNWFDFVGCYDAVRDAWNCDPHGNPMHAFSHLLSRSCHKLREWHRTGVNRADSDMINIKAEISHLENSDFNLISQSLLFDHYVNLSTLQRQCCNMWAQRARLAWVKDGDRNTSFFHATTRIHAHTNFISQVVDVHDNHCRDQSSIERVFLTFYKELWNHTTTTMPTTFDALPANLPSISDSVAASLIREVTIEEVYSTILDLPAGKSPGPDGFNSEFYQNFWPIIGDCLYAAIQFFFANSSIPTSWGKTFVTLIPKKNNPRHVTDFRPIALCNVNFKIITKLLANRLKLVLPNLIGREQVGFVSDRCSFDNIIAVQEAVHTLESDTKNP